MPDIVIYKNDSNAIEVELKFEKKTFWLSLNEISTLFERDKSVISRHIKKIYTDNELLPHSTVAKKATVQKEGNRKISREIEYYNLVSHHYNDSI